MSRYRGLFGLCVLTLLLGFLTQAGVGALWYSSSMQDWEFWTKGRKTLAPMGGPIVSSNPFSQGTVRENATATFIDFPLELPWEESRWCAFYSPRYIENHGSAEHGSPVMPQWVWSP